MPPQSNSAVVDDEYGLEPAKPAAAGVTDDKYGLEPAGKSDKLAFSPGSFQQRKGGPVLNANTTGIQGQSKKEVTQNLKADAAGGARVGPGPTPGRVASEAGLGAASGFSGMPESSTPLKDFGTGLKSQQDELLQHPVKTIAKNALFGPAPQLYEMGKGLVESGGEIGSGVIHADPEKVAHGGGRLVGQLAQLGVLKESPEAAGNESSVGKVAAKVARDPNTGELKPGAVTAGKVGGGIVGGVVGGAGGSELLGTTTHPHSLPGAAYGAIQGATAGAALGPTVLEKMIPPRPIYPGAPLPKYEDFAENHAEDLTKRGKEQARIDKTNEGKLKEAEETRQRDLADRGKLEMQDATEQSAAIRRQNAADAKEKAANAPKIVQPGVQTGPNVESEGRPATWTNESLVSSARTGNRPAIAQKILRNLPLGENERYVMGDPNYSSLVTSPREVTKFGPTGEPIRLEAGRPMGKNLDPLAAASRQRPLLAGKPPVPSGPGTAPLDFERPIQVPSEGPVKPMTPPAGEQAAPEQVKPMQKPALPPEGVAERRQSLRDMNGPDFTRTARLNDLRKNIAAETDPEIKQTLQAQYDDMKANPFEKHEGGDLNSMKAKKTVSREEAEANTEARKAGRTQRFSGEAVKPMEKPNVEEEPQDVHIKGLTAKERVKPMQRPVSIDKKYGPDTITEAEGLIHQEIGMMSSADRPGVYFDAYGQEERPTAEGLKGGWKRGETSSGQWRGVGSLRPHLPFMKANRDFTPAQLEKAMRNKDSAMYSKAMERAIEFIRREKAAKNDATEIGKHVPGEEEFPPKE